MINKIYFNFNFKKYQTTLLYFVAIISTLYTFRFTFSGELLGDPFDARLHIVLHEHWWQWFQGEVEFRNTNFFYPFDKALGYSDVFLLQGIIYSLFRLLNFEITQAWTISSLTIVILGNFGWVKISQLYLKKYISKIFFILTITTSLSFVNYFTLNPNASGYTLVSWLVLLYISAVNEKNLKNKNIKYNFLILLTLIYSLTCWYAAFFFSFTILLKKIIDIFFTKELLKFDFKKINFKIISIFFPVNLFFLSIFMYVYLPVSNQPFRSVEELIDGSPRIGLLPNGGNLSSTGLDGAFFPYLYELFNLNFKQEFGFGLGIFVTLFAFIFGVIFFLNNFKNYKLIIWPITITLTYIIFVAFGNSFSLFSIFFEFIPGFNSIRYPSRYVIFLGYFLIFSIFYFLDTYNINSKSILKSVLPFLIILIVFLDQVRAPFDGWDKELLVNEYLNSQSAFIVKNCDYFYYDYPGGWWSKQIEAMVFSMQTGVPTVNGYSGGFPPGYPVQDFLSVDLSEDVIDWINNIDITKTGCWVTGRSPVRIIDNDFTLLELVGFTPTETDGKNNWNWAVTPNPYLYVVNFTGKDFNLNFQINKNKCVDQQIIELESKNMNKLRVVNEGKVDLNLNFARTIVQKILISTDSKSCKIGNDPRELYFEVKNLKYE